MQGDHPSPEQLAAFSSGLISDLDLARISAHLVACTSCCADLDRLGTQDTLQQQIKEAAIGRPLVEPTLRSDAVLALQERQAARSATDEANDRAVLALLSPSTRPGALGRLGPYEVLEIVGRGGMGIVFRAEDCKLQRVVAVKILAPQLAASGAARQRFIREAQAAAAVRDEHVVAVHAVEDDFVNPYLVMEYIGGRTLEDLVRATGPLEVMSILRIGMQTACGLAAAHKQGLIHRDIKPANILLEDGVQRVKLTDFGLARAADDASLTRSGVIAGTPMYMSPEQAQAVGIDSRTDLFSLGSVLYTLCTGRPPFRAEAPLAVLLRVCHETPRPIREINPAIPAWLAEVVTRLMEKDPARRIQSASEVADLLAGYLAHIQNPAQTPAPRLANAPRPARRGWRVAIPAAVLLVALLAGAYYFTRPRGVHRQAGWTPPTPPTAEELAKRPSPLDGRQPGQIPGPALRALGMDPDFAPPELIGLLGAPQPFEVGRRSREKSACIPRAWSRDGKRLVSSGLDRVRVWSEAGALLAELPTCGVLTNLPAFSPDGSRLVTLGGKETDGENRLVIWDAQTFTRLHTLEGHARRIWDAAFSPDGKTLASGDEGGIVRFWDVESAKLLAALDAHRGEAAGISRVVFAEKAKRLATHGLRDGLVRLWDMDPESPTYRQTLHEWEALARAAATEHTLLFTADDQRLLYEARQEKRTFRVADTTSGKVLQDLAPPELSHEGKAVLADGGKTLAVLNARGAEVCLIDLATARATRRVQLEALGESANLVSDPAGKRLAIGGADSHQVKFIDVASGSQHAVDAPALHGGLVFSVAVSPDGRTVASAGADRIVRLWDLATGRITRTLSGHEFAVVAVAFSPDGTVLATHGSGGTILLWQVANGERLHTLATTTETSSLAFHPDGASLVASRGESVGQWRLSNGEPGAALAEGNAARALAFSPDGQWLAVAGGDRVVRLIEVATGQARHLFTGTEPFNAVAFSPDSRSLFTVGDAPNAALQRWNVHSGDAAKWLGHSATIRSLSVHPAGSLVATASQDGTVRLWDTTPGSERWLAIDLNALGGRAMCVAFTPEGRYLVAGMQFGAIAVLRVTHPPTYSPGVSASLPATEELAKRPSAADALSRDKIPPDLVQRAGGENAPPLLTAILNQGHGAMSVAYSPDGALLACGCTDKEVRLWDLATGTVRPSLIGHQSIVRYVSFNQDGTLLASASEDRTAKVWNVRTGVVVRTFVGHQDFLERALFTPDGQSLVTCGRDRTIRVWDVATGRPLRALMGTGEPAIGAWSIGYWCASISPDGRIVATGEADGSIRLWDLATGWHIANLRGHSSIVRGLAYHPGGRLLASSGYDKTVRLWNMTRLTQGAAKLMHHTDEVMEVSWSSDGRLLASAGAVDGTVGITDTATPDLRTSTFRIVPPNQRYLHSVALSPDGRYLAIAPPNTTVYLLRLAARGEVYRPGK